MEQSEKDKILQGYPGASSFIRPYVGPQEMLKGIVRYCLWIADSTYEQAIQHKPILERLNFVRDYRLKSTKKSTRKSADKPYLFDELRHTETKSMILIPRSSSGERHFLPVSICSQNEIAGDVFMILDSELEHFAILSSTMHRCWLKSVSGKLGDGYRYSNTLVWNTFPMPELSDDDKEALNKTAQKILNARHYHPDLTLGDMYNPGNMGPQLLAAHKENDRVLEKIFRDKPFKNDEDRLAHLFERYAEMVDKEYCGD